MISNWTAENIPDLTGKTAIVTGANSGIGFTTAQALARKNATVILACRDEYKGNAAVQRITQGYPKAKAELMRLDLSDLGSAHCFAQEFTNHHARLDILINNAGIMWAPEGKTVDGFELQFGINHLAHFALTGLLLENIIRTPQARIVTVSSWGHRFGEIDFDNLNAEKGYDPERAYAQSKLANILFTYKLQRRFDGAGVDTRATAVHPGATVTNLPNSWTTTSPRDHWRMIRVLNSYIGQKPEMGALPTLYAATALDVQGGDYYGPGSWGGLRGYPQKVRSSERSYDLDVASKLWIVSEKLTGVTYYWSVKNKIRQ